MRSQPTVSTLAVKLFLLLFVFLSAPLKGWTTHITGGEISYAHISGNTYELTLKIYRDCMNGQAGFDDPANVSVFNSSNTALQVVSIPFQGAVALPYIPADTNWYPQGYACVEQATYVQQFTFTQSLAGCTFAYQRCCRTADIINYTNPLNTGSTYWEHIPAVYPNNSSPVFHTPPLVLCIDRPMTFDHSATDPDGDSLVYMLCSSYDGANVINPQPALASNPPYTTIPYSGSYSVTNPISASPAISIDSLTGVVTLTPNLLGNFMIGICCEEYRNGQLIGTHHSDFRYSVANCPWGVGVEDYNSVSCQVYPNPVSDRIIFSSGNEISITIYNAWGKVVFETATTLTNQVVNCTDWTTGVYYYRVNYKDRFTSGKIIKQ